MSRNSPDEDEFQAIIIGEIRVQAMSPAIPTQPSNQTAITSDQALHVARLDAEKVYGDLTPYRVTLVLEVDGWHVDYDLKNPLWNGGAPHYLIDPANGAILSKRYEQ
jgi:hypothetical protein